MTSVTVAVWVMVPLAPVIVSVEVPRWELFAETTRNVDVPDPVTVVGVKVAVTRCGNPATVRFTVPVKPFCAPTVTVYVAVPPREMVTLAGVAVNVKLAGAVTTSVTVVECTKPASVPVMVMV